MNRITCEDCDYSHTTADAPGQLFCHLNPPKVFCIPGQQMGVAGPQLVVQFASSHPPVKEFMTCSHAIRKTPKLAS